MGVKSETFSYSNESNTPQCFKITEKVAFNIASEASNDYILSRQKLVKSVKKIYFWKTWACGQTVLPDLSVFVGQKLVENAKIQKRHFEWFSNTVHSEHLLLMSSVQDEVVFKIDYFYVVLHLNMMCSIPNTFSLLWRK